jgi:hypothetical protein
LGEQTLTNPKPLHVPPLPRPLDKMPGGYLVRDARRGGRDNITQCFPDGRLCLFELLVVF